LIAERTGLEVSSPIHAGTVEHIFTHLKLSLHVFRCGEAPGRVKLRNYQAHKWVSKEKLDDLPQATLARKSLELLL
jgi:adenine-specific DNA glycosylase